MDTTKKLSVDEFAQSIKTKYPQYKDIDNNTLAQKMVAKYPTYSTKVNMGTPVTPTAPSATSSLGTAQPSSFSSKVGGVAKAIGGFGLDLGIGAVKETASTLQGLGSLITKPISAVTGLEGGFSNEALAAKNTAQSIGAFGADVAMAIAQPEIGLEKLGLSGILKLAESGKLGGTASQQLIKAVASKYGKKTAQLISDMVSGSTQEAVRETGQTGAYDTSKIIGSGILTAGGKQAALGVGKLMSKTGAKAGESTAKTLKHLQSTEETMTKAERAAAESRLTSTKMGGKVYKASKEEENAAKILEGKTTGNPVKDKEIIKKEIATRGQEVETFLSKNAKPVTAKEQLGIFDKLRKDSELYLSKTELKAYDEQKKIFEGILNKESKGKGFNTETFYRAIKDFEANVADKLPRGKEALIDPTGIANAKIRAVADIRKGVRDLIGDKHKEFKTKMFDLASLYDVKGTVLTKADQLKGNAITRALTSKPAKVIGGTVLAGGLIGGGMETAKKIGSLIP